MARAHRGVWYGGRRSLERFAHCHAAFMAGILNVDRPSKLWSRVQAGWCCLLLYGNIGCKRSRAWRFAWGTVLQASVTACTCWQADLSWGLDLDLDLGERSRQWRGG
jgi:hypothetical protein